MEAAGVRVSVGYTPRVRLVLHRDVDDAGLQRAIDALRAFPG
jgi:threonine aldolase